MNEAELDRIFTKSELIYTAGKVIDSESMDKMVKELKDDILQDQPKAKSDNNWEQLLRELNVHETNQGTLLDALQEYNFPSKKTTTI